MRQENNLLILGNIYVDLFILKENQLFSLKETNEYFDIFKKL